MSEKIYLYPVWIRLWHALNAVFFLTLLATGISMQYSSLSVPLIRFDLSVTLHNIAGVGLTINYVFFLFGNIFTSNGKYYRLNLRQLWGELNLQAVYYLRGIFKHEKAPFEINKERKFNPLQLVSYAAAMFVLMPIAAISGLALLFPEFIVPQVLGISGTLLTALFHMTVSFFLSVFMIVHIYMCTVGKTPTSNFKSMVNGFHESH
jgi:thiosulfate reductase cytochrome b subunit